jgi:hypothetical protein
VRFFDNNGVAIPGHQWAELFEQYYFLGGPTIGRRLNRKNQSCRWVEDDVCRLLNKSMLSFDDLKKIVAWKIGAINHSSCESTGNYKYYQDWDLSLQDRYHRSYLHPITEISKVIPSLLQMSKSRQYQQIFDMHKSLKGFGPVYMLTIVFFLSHGDEPIYDKFADIAGQSILNGCAPDSFIRYRVVSTWEDYEKYKQMLASIAEQCGDSKITRTIDRALWSYGHLFRSQ